MNRLGIKEWQKIFEISFLNLNASSSSCFAKEFSFLSLPMILASLVSCSLKKMF
jgi:hypothetical protein